LRLPPPPGDVNGICGQGDPLHLLALGDSIIAGIGASEKEHTLPVQFAYYLAHELHRQVHWHALGENGARLKDVLERLASLDRATPADLILLSIGVNDVTGLTRLETWNLQLEQLLTHIDGRWPKALVLFCGLPPMELFPLPPQPLRFSLGLRARTLDHAAETLLAGKERKIHIPTHINPAEHEFCPDGFHPSVESYAIWGKELANRVTEQNLERLLPDRYRV
jgi:lysophospholipase L1-like esterase